MASSCEFTPAELEQFANSIVAKLKELFIAPCLEQVMTGDELAQFLKVAKATVERRTRDGSIPSVKVGDARRYVVQEVLDALNGGSSTSTTTAAF